MRGQSAFNQIDRLREISCMIFGAAAAATGGFLRHLRLLGVFLLVLPPLWGIASMLMLVVEEQLIT